METTYIGLVDCYEPKESTVRKTKDPSTTIIDLTMETDFDGIVDRIVTPAYIRKPNTDTLHSVKALWDTGSRTSCISAKMAQEMELVPVSTMACVTPVGVIENPVYYADIIMYGEFEFRNVMITEYPLEKHDVDILIGMDIISKGRLVIDSSDGKTVLMFTKK